MATTLTKMFVSKLGNINGVFTWLAKPDVMIRCTKMTDKLSDEIPDVKECSDPFLLV